MQVLPSFPRSFTPLSPLPLRQHRRAHMLPRIFGFPSACFILLLSRFPSGFMLCPAPSSFYNPHPDNPICLRCPSCSRSAAPSIPSTPAPSTPSSSPQVASFCLWLQAAKLRVWVQMCHVFLDGGRVRVAGVGEGMGGARPA